MIYLLGSVGTLALLIFALADIISGHGDHIKNLDKMTWIFIVILVPLVGAILWFLVGREWGNTAENLGSFGDSRRAEAVGFGAPSSTEDELAALEREIAFHENQDRIRRLEAELKAKGQTASE
ncbi:PLDc_N domain-containing protein [Glaciihabitans arcticus]|uniref:PLDc_N domain-containing protein n=1 Tax=Glaciihabitans arcticus TaxID=2668039 RepID=A0A4Q9GMU0_9MICO|nr:PLD nuclease N-terminal domain-containing protein [Glaciihabitans arcticus]TBN56102.1 PLDc_N domain-containing protein [Glaciihabitans arcticus]